MTIGRALGKMSARDIFANAEAWNQGVKKKKFDAALGEYEVGAGIDQPAIARMMGISPKATMAYIQFENATMERKRAEKERKRQRTIAGKEWLTKAFGNLNPDGADFSQKAAMTFGMYAKQYPEDAKAMQQMFGNDKGKMVGMGKFFNDLAHKDPTAEQKLKAKRDTETFETGKRRSATAEKRAERAEKRAIATGERAKEKHALALAKAGKVKPEMTRAKAQKELVQLEKAVVRTQATGGIDEVFFMMITKDNPEFAKELKTMDKSELLEAMDEYRKTLKAFIGDEEEEALADEKKPEKGKDFLGILPK